MAAMRRADSDNLEKLIEAFPKQWEELQVRYNAPAGFVSFEEAKVFSKLRQKDLKQVEFPMEGWPYGA